MERSALVAVTVVGLLLASSAFSQDAPPARTELLERYHWLYDRDSPVIVDSMACTSVELDRRPGRSMLPSYVLTLRRDGSAMYRGRKFDERPGVHVGRVDLESYGRLCYLIEFSGLLAKSREWRANWTDASTAIVTITTDDERSVVLHDYGQQSPPEVWAIQELIDLVASDISWHARADLE